MSKIISCGIAPIRKNNDQIEILLAQPTNFKNPNSKYFYGMGFLKGQFEQDDESYLYA